MAVRPAVYRGTVLHFLADPGMAGEPGSYELFEDGALAVDGDGFVAWVGEWPRLPEEFRGEVVDHRGQLILPGFVDAHTHYSQFDAIASYGGELPDWLAEYIYPAERRFDRTAHAEFVAELFLDTLVACGTTTAAVHPTVHPESVDAFCAAAVRRGMRMVCGKVLMDDGPPDLRETTADSERHTRELIARWHHTARLTYAITPRFAPSCTDAQLTMAARLFHDMPDVRLQTHAAENLAETEDVLDRFPAARSYVDVYDRFGLLRPGALLAHCVHIDDRDRARLAETGTAVAFCPTSNLFLGSGLFDLAAARGAGVRVGLGTDCGAGTTYSMLRTLGEAYKVVMLREAGRDHPLRLSAWLGLYLATLGGAEALGLADRIGNFRPGKEADFVVLDWAATPVLRRRTEIARDLEERLFALLTLGDERAVSATYVMGRLG
ncbi:guanine deaminase [Nocardia sp. NPDC003482]